MRWMTGVLLAALWGSTPASAAESWIGGGRAEYTLVHKFHTVVGACDKVEARATMEDGALKVMARAPASCFNSGNANRDSNALATVAAGAHPLVVVRGTASDVQLPSQGKKTITLDATVELKGESVSHPIEVTIERKGPTSAAVTFDFQESLTAHKIERPSLLMIPVDDQLRVRGNLTLELKP